MRHAQHVTHCKMAVVPRGDAHYTHNGQGNAVLARQPSTAPFCNLPITEAKHAHTCTEEGCHNGQQQHGLRSTRGEAS